MLTTNLETLEQGNNLLDLAWILEGKSLEDLPRCKCVEGYQSLTPDNDILLQYENSVFVVTDTKRGETQIAPLGMLDDQGTLGILCVPQWVFSDEVEYLK